MTKFKTATFAKGETAETINFPEKQYVKTGRVIIPDFYPDNGEGFMNEKNEVVEDVNITPFLCYATQSFVVSSSDFLIKGDGTVFCLVLENV